MKNDFYNTKSIFIQRGDNMTYVKIIDKINKKQNIDKERLYNLYIKTYKNDNIRSFDNMLSYLKKIIY